MRGVLRKDQGDSRLIRKWHSFGTTFTVVLIVTALLYFATQQERRNEYRKGDLVFNSEGVEELHSQALGVLQSIPYLQFDTPITVGSYRAPFRITEIKSRWENTQEPTLYWEGDGKKLEKNHVYLLTFYPQETQHVDSRYYVLIIGKVNFDLPDAATMAALYEKDVGFTASAFFI